MRNFADLYNELPSGEDLTAVYDLARQLPDTFYQLALHTGLDNHYVRYIGIPFREQVAGKETDHTMSYSFLRQGGAAPTHAMHVYYNGAKTATYKCRTGGEWRLLGEGSGQELGDDSDMLSRISASTPKPHADVAAVEAAYMDNRLTSDVARYIIDIAGRNATYFENVGTYSAADIIQISSDGMLNSYSVELKEVQEGGTSNGLDETHHLLSVKRPSVRDGKTGIEHLELTIRSWGTVFAGVTFECDGEESEIGIEDAQEFLQQMEQALTSLLKAKSQTTV